MDRRLEGFPVGVRGLNGVLVTNKMPENFTPREIWEYLLKIMPFIQSKSRESVFDDFEKSIGECPDDLFQEFDKLI